MAEGGSSTSPDADVPSCYIKELKMDIPPHRDTVVPIKGPVIHNASKFMASHLELNYINISHHFKSVTGALNTGTLQYSSKYVFRQRVPVTGVPVRHVILLYFERP